MHNHIHYKRKRHPRIKHAIAPKNEYKDYTTKNFLSFCRFATQLISTFIPQSKQDQIIQLAQTDYYHVKTINHDESE